MKQSSSRSIMAEERPRLMNAAPRQTVKSSEPMRMTIPCIHVMLHLDDRMSRLAVVQERENAVFRADAGIISKAYQSIELILGKPAIRKSLPHNLRCLFQAMKKR